MAGCTSQDDDRERRKYKIDIGAYGSKAVEAPTKKECLGLLKEVTKTKREPRIDDAIRLLYLKNKNQLLIVASKFGKY